MPAGHPFPMGKYPLLKQRLVEEGIVRSEDLLEPIPLERSTLALVLLAEITLGLGAVGAGGIKLGTADGSAPITTGTSNIEQIGMLLYGKYLFLFETAGIILLVAMVGAIVLTHRKRAGVRGQNVAKQNARRPDEATVNMSPEVGKGVEL